MTADNWSLDVKLRVTGRGRLGADGMVNDTCLRLKDARIIRTYQNIDYLFLLTKHLRRMNNTNRKSTFSRHELHSPNVHKSSLIPICNIGNYDLI